MFTPPSSLAVDDNALKPQLAMDNAAFHKTNMIQTLMHNMIMSRNYLPPYTPALNTAMTSASVSSRVVVHR